MASIPRRQEASVWAALCRLPMRVLRKVTEEPVHAWRLRRLIRARDRVIRDYLDTHPVRKLQVGGGIHVLPGWLNTDARPSVDGVIYLDATVPFPLAAETIDYVFCEHLLEHLTYDTGLRFLRECHRVLRPGGRIRIATPDLRFLVALYTTQPKRDIQQRYIAWAMREFLPHIERHDEAFVVNNFFYNWGHKFIYDPPVLTHALMSTGFSAVTPCAPGESSDPELRGLERHSEGFSEEFNELETFVLEATRPAS